MANPIIDSMLDAESRREIAENRWHDYVRTLEGEFLTENRRRLALERLVSRYLARGMTLDWFRAEFERWRERANA